MDVIVVVGGEEWAENGQEEEEAQKREGKEGRAV